MRHFTLFSILAVLVAIIIPTKGYGAIITTIQGKEYNIDTLRHVKVGPGTYQTSLLYRATDGSKKFRGFFLTMEMKGHDNVEFRMEVGNDSTLTGEQISALAKRKSAPNNYYFAAVNADFYLTWAPYVGTPNKACYMDGQIAGDDRDQNSVCSHFLIDYEKNMWCDYLKQTLSFTKPDNSAVNLTRINYDLFTNEIVLFNSLYGHYTKTSNDASEIAVKLIEGEKWRINSPVKVQVVGALKAGGNMRIEPNGAVISAKGTAIANIENLKDGDILTLNFNTQLGLYNVSPNLKECSGGDALILKRGEVMYEASWWCNGRDNNNPRTMFGYNEDRTKMVWGLIDGRSTISDGCTYPEGADVMKLAGCYDATNVDGGGSAGMYVQNLGIVNVPSDGNERGVSNGMYAVLKAPEDNNIAEIQFVDYAMDFPKYGIYTPKFFGYNQYGMLIDTDLQGVTLSCDPKLGSIKDGITFIGNGSGTYPLVASYNGIKATIPVTIIEGGNVNFRLSNIINDTYREYPVEVQAKVNETDMPISPTALIWHSEDADIATIGVDSGILKGVANGSTTVHGSLGDFVGTLNVTVEKPTDNVMAIEPEMDPTTWNLTQVGGKNIKATAIDNGMKLTYTGSSGRGPNIKLSKEVRLWSLPDVIRLRINPGDAPIKKITLSTRANDKGVVNTVVATEVKANETNTIDLRTSDWCDAKDLSNFPLKLNYIQFEMGTSTTGKEFTIDIPGMELVYDAVQSGGAESVTISDNNISVYPNPASRGETVNVKWNNIDVETINIYNEAGVMEAQYNVASDASSISIPTASLEVGTYILSVVTDKNISSSKLIIK